MVIGYEEDEREWALAHRLKQQSTRHCSICRAETTGASLCDRCARHLRQECRLAHLAIACGVNLHSGGIANLRRDEEKLAEYDANRAHRNFTCEVHDDRT